MAKLLPEVWSEAEQILLEWEQVTEKLRRAICSSGSTELVNSLLERRQRLCDRLDTLRSANSIDSWTKGPEGVAIAAIFRRLTVMDQEIKREMELKLHSLQQGIDQVHRARAAGSAYHGRRPQHCGAFIDTKR